MANTETSEPATADSTLPQDDVDAIDELRNVYDQLTRELGKIIVGQRTVIEELAICLFARGHSLLMGVPGLAKTNSHLSMQSEMCYNSQHGESRA